MGRIRNLLLLAVAALFLAACAGLHGQPSLKSKVHRIGTLSLGGPGGASHDAFRKGLAELGYVEGRNVAFEGRHAEGKPERLPALAGELAAAGVDVIFVGATQPTLALKRATSTVPIVFAAVVDPVSTGIVASLDRPGGNVTGTTFGIDARQWISLMKETVPGATQVAVLRNTANPANAFIVRELEAAANAANVRLQLFDAGDAAKVDQALKAIEASGSRALMVTPDPLFNANRAAIIRFAASKRIPAIYFAKEFVDEGGLMAQASSLTDSYYRAAAHVDKVLKGARAGELAIDRPTKFELIVNRKAAKELGIAIPPSILARADRVIGE